MVLRRGGFSARGPRHSGVRAGRTGLDPNRLSDVIVGCALQRGEQSGNVARNALLGAGLPIALPGTTLDRQCGSGQQAIHFAAQAIKSGEYDFAIGAGVESMSRVDLGPLFGRLLARQVADMAASLDPAGSPFTLLEAARAFWGTLEGEAKAAFRFHHVSTDEVYGSLKPSDPPFAETNPYEPNSPYSASKAASDHLVRAWHHTYGLPVLTTNCSNNYGPYHFPEKLIPLMIVNALAGKPLPVYGDGQQIRDWLYVKDHCSGIRAVLAGGRLGETYNIGGWNEKANLDIVQTVCALLDELRPDPAGPYRRLITYVTDRPGHDRRYAIDARKIERELGWRPAETFETGIRKTVQWYLDHPDWVADVQSGAYKDWVGQNYGAR